MPDKIILKESRRTFLFIYALIAIFASAIIYLSVNGTSFSKEGLLISGAVIIVGILTPEVVRSWETCTVKKDKINIISGMIKKKHHKFFTSTITDIHLKQNLWQRMLNYGTIEVSLFSHEGEVRLGTVDKPSKRVQQIEDLIGKEAAHTPGH